jgi:hypothetical protein
MIIKQSLGIITLKTSNGNVTFKSNLGTISFRKEVPNVVVTVLSLDFSKVENSQYIALI